MTCLERGIDPLEYVFECRDVVHMDNLLVYLNDSISLIKCASVASGIVPAPLADFPFVQDTGEVLEDPFNGLGHGNI